MLKIFALVLLMVGCGSEREIEPKEAPPAAGPPPVSAPSSFAEIKPLLDKYCIRCHAGDGFLLAEARWKASQGPARVQNKSMPQAGSQEAKAFTEADRAKILSLK